MMMGDTNASTDMDMDIHSSNSTESDADPLGEVIDNLEDRLENALADVCNLQKELDALLDNIDDVQNSYEQVEMRDVTKVLTRNPNVKEKIDILLFRRDNTFRVFKVDVGIRADVLCRIAANTFNVEDPKSFRIFIQRANRVERVLLDAELPGKIQCDIMDGKGDLYIALPRKPGAPGQDEGSKVFRFIFSNVPLAEQTGILNISGKGLSQFPMVIFRIRNLQHLFMRQNHITVLPPELPRLTSLTKLHLVKNGLTSLPTVICQLPNLTELDIGNNNLKDLPAEMAQMTRLTDLFLYSNEFKTVPAVVSKLSLRNLSLTSNFITEIPQHMEALTSITELRLSSNFIKEVPAFFGDFKRLHVLCLRRNNLTSIPVELANCHNLSQLNIKDNNISSIPPQIKRLLNSLTAERNQFEVMPSELGEFILFVNFRDNHIKTMNPLMMGALQELNLSDNQLESLPSDWTRTPNLARLSVANNKLTALPAGLAACKKLTDLYFFCNRITKFPAELCTAKLEKLDGHSNLITELPSVLLKNAINLSVVNMSDNLLKSLPSGGQKARVLKELYLASNQLTDGVWSSLTTIKTLKHLNLSFNKLTKFDISKLTELLVFHISGNHLSRLPHDIMNCKGLQELYLAYCGLKVLDPIIGRLDKLLVLDLAGNNLVDLPPTLGNIRTLRDLHLCSNPIRLLPDSLTTLPELRMVELANTFLTVDTVTPSLRRHLHAEERKESSRYKAALSEMQGRRNHMEDASCIYGNLGSKFDFFGIYDGHGGTAIAEFCSQNLHTSLAQLLTSGEKPYTAIDKVFDVISKKLLDKKLGTSCGCTVAVMLAASEQLYFANAGDARTGKAIRCSFDHKPFITSEEDRIKNLGGYITEEGRVNGILAVARSIGDFMLSPYVTHSPFVNVLDVSRDDEFVILACDGVWDVISDEDAVAIVQEALREHPGRADYAAYKLRHLSYSYGSADNITVMVVLMQRDKNVPEPSISPDYPSENSGSSSDSEMPLSNHDVDDVFVSAAVEFDNSPVPVQVAGVVDHEIPVQAIDQSQPIATDPIVSEEVRKGADPVLITEPEQTVSPEPSNPDGVKTESVVSDVTHESKTEEQASSEPVAVTSEETVNPSASETAEVKSVEEPEEAKTDDGKTVDDTKVEDKI